MRRRSAFIILVVLLASTAYGEAKELHFARVRVLLMSKAARCTSCHADSKGASLNAYGERLTALSHDDPLADRMAALEAEPSVKADADARRQAREDRDVDRDGVANWIEILANSNPADAKDTPNAETARRIERVISCKLCHRATNLPGEGLEANPHNELGAFLAKTFVRRRGRRAPKDAEQVRSAAERTPILTRLSMIRKKRPKRSRATYWEKIRLLHAPADSHDTPSRAALRAFRKDAARQRRRKTRDAGRGLTSKAHGPDGFLLDVDKPLD
ncbi:MAG: hypothetical protein ACE5F9_08555 [Phycisphaerae bacterium]